MAMFSRIVGLALIVDQGDGRRVMYTSQTVHSTTLSVHHDFEQELFLDSVFPQSSYRQYYPTSSEITLECQMRDLNRYGTEVVVDPSYKQLPSGIYLPDMAYHATMPEQKRLLGSGEE